VAKWQTKGLHTVRSIEVNANANTVKAVTNLHNLKLVSASSMAVVDDVQSPVVSKAPEINTFAEPTVEANVALLKLVKSFLLGVMMSVQPMVEVNDVKLMVAVNVRSQVLISVFDMEVDANVE